jgi:prophage regulatory protein
MSNTSDNTQRKPRNKVTYKPAPLPTEGVVVRLPSVLAVLSISKTSFLDGIKANKYPPGKLLSPRCRVWPVAQIRALLAELEKVGAA